MTDSEITEHLSTSKMELFCARGLPETELSKVARHLAKCSDCHQLFVSTLKRQKGVAALSFTLAPEFWLRHEHIDYEQLVQLADHKLDPTDRELIDLHLNVCPPCQEDVRSFLAFRDQIAPELEVSYAPVVIVPAREKLSWLSLWRGLSWKPIYATAIVLIGIALILGVLFLQRRADNLEARTPTANDNLAAASQSPTPDNRASIDPSPPVTPNESPVEKSNGVPAMVALRDRGSIVTVDTGGNVSGLDDVPASTRDEIAQALLSGRIERPTILKDLDGQDSTLRGSTSKASFNLISPARTVLVSDRPIFKWERVPDASSYRVYVNDPKGVEIARSEELSPERTEWTVSKPLRRGEIYAWTVVAIVDGNEIVSPASSSPEMKFQVLTTSSLQQLNKLKKTRSHLALAVFYTREGMIAEAEREFQILIRENPNSAVAKKLLKQVQHWHGR